MYPTSLTPLLQLAHQINDVADHVEQDVLKYQDPVAVACARHELWLACERMSHALESTWTPDDNLAAVDAALGR